MRRRRSKEKSKRHFNRWSRSYEDDKTSRRLAEVQTKALGALELGPKDRLLDIGCGTGAAVRDAAPVVKRAAGVDLSPGMIARANELAEGLKNVKFVEADSERLPFKDEKFTALLCTTSFHHYPDPRRAVSEMARVLKPGGRVVIGDACTDRFGMRAFDLVLRMVQRSHVRMYRSRELRAFLADAGLETDAPLLLWNRRWAVARGRKHA